MTVSSSEPKIGLASRMVNAVLAIKPLADFAKSRARKMMIDRAETIGVPWRENVNKLAALSWSQELAAVQDDSLVYPEYYTTSFHAYEAGNLSWQAAWEVESAALAVHAKIWSAGDNGGDAQLRQSYHQILQQQIAMPTAGHAPTTPQTILDLGCGVGMSTRALQAIYPQGEDYGSRSFSLFFWQ